MSEVIDRPLMIRPKEAERREAIKPPTRYIVEAWSGGHVCSRKFAMVVAEVFQIPKSVAHVLVSVIEQQRRVPVAIGLTREVAETKADQATKKLGELVGRCPCGHKMKFVPVQEIT